MIILKCHQSQDPPGALIKASRTFKSPILTVLATFYEASDFIPTQTANDVCNRLFI
jgi:hypothetical protein